MSSNHCTPSNQKQDTPVWLQELVGAGPVYEGNRVTVDGRLYVCQQGILRAQSLFSSSQKQTEETFGFKWQKRDTFESASSLARMRAWLIERYGDIANAEWWKEYGDFPLVLDAGCGAAMSGLELFDGVFDKIRYIGADVSEAVDVAARRFSEKGLEGGFIQSDLGTLPFPKNSIDVIFSEGVLHHTDSTEKALKKLAEHLRPNGRFLFYVYRQKGPIREFTDDVIREKLQDMSPNQAWEALIPLSRLGEVFGELNIEIDVPESIDLLEIPAGKINLQRLIYWHVFKAFYREGMTLDEMNHINFDWFAPANAHRQTPEEVRRWCIEAGLEIEREVVENAGITIVARKKG